MNLRCLDVFIIFFFFALFGFLSLFVIYFISHGVKWSYWHPSPCTHGVYYMPLSASSGAAGSGDANTKGLHGVWDCSECLRHSRCLVRMRCVPPSTTSHSSRAEGPAGKCVPQVPTTSWGTSQPALSFPAQPLTNDFDTFEIICTFIWFLMALMCMLWCFGFQPNY